MEKNQDFRIFPCLQVCFYKNVCMYVQKKFITGNGALRLQLMLAKAKGSFAMSQSFH